MRTNKYLLFLILILVSTESYAQQDSSLLPADPLYKRVAIMKPTMNQINALNELGVDLTCGAVFQNDSLNLELNEHILDELENNGISYEVLIENLVEHYGSRAQELPKARAELKAMKADANHKNINEIRQLWNNENCEEIDWLVPNNFNLNPNSSPNSFGGCLTYDQLLEELDDMRAQYPHLISEKLDASPSNQKTIEGRSIFYLRISDNPDVDEEEEPETLYQSLIHSREPSSLMQMLFFMWYVLENYETDPDVKNLINNQALYFIPVFNPDGFVYNQIQNPDGGGLQRKNRNVSSTCSIFLDGIDLNRNSAYYWGNGGASSDECSNIFLGTAPFSENETQIMRDFFLQHDFKLSLNHHSFKNAMLHAYAGTEITNPRPDEYSKYNHDMTFYNRYAYGPSTSISALNSGNMNDWMLGGPAGISMNGTPTGTGSGKNTMAWTPENGTSSEGGFWPNPSNYVIIAKRAMRMNFLAAFFSGKFAILHDLNQSEISSVSGKLTFGIENLGQTPSDFELNLTPLSSNILSPPSVKTISGLTILAQEEVAIEYTLDPTIQSNDTIEFLLSLTNDYLSDNILYSTTITKIYQPKIIFKDDPDTDGLLNWSSSGGEWFLTSDAYSGASAITSTINPPYLNNESKFLELNKTLDLSGAKKLLLQYYGKWDLERSFDYVQLEASTNGSSWFPLCGKLTKGGAPDINNTYSAKPNADNNFQPDGADLYDGDTQGKWHMEEVIIDEQNNSNLIGESVVRLRFNFKTDGSNRQDAYYNANFEGFTFDDFSCTLIDGISTKVYDFWANEVKLFPNPITQHVTVEWNQSRRIKRLSIVDIFGHLIYSASNLKTSSVDIDTNDWSPGVYFVMVDGNETKKLIKL